MKCVQRYPISMGGPLKIVMPVGATVLGVSDDPLSAGNLMAALIDPHETATEERSFYTCLQGETIEEFLGEFIGCIAQHGSSNDWFVWEVVPRVVEAPKPSPVPAMDGPIVAPRKGAKPGVRKSKSL